MGKEGELQKKKQKQDYAGLLGQQEVNSYENHLFDVDKYGGEQEANALIERYEKKITLSDEDKEVLRNNVPEAPSFDVMRKEQYDKKGCWKKKKYKEKVKDYYSYREKYYTSTESEEGKLSKGAIFAQKRQELEKRFAEAEGIVLEDKKEEKVQVEAEKKTVKQKELGEEEFSEEAKKKAEEELKQTEEKYKNIPGMFDDIPDNMIEIERVFRERRENKEIIEAEKEIGEKQVNLLLKSDKNAGKGIKTYTGTGYREMNSILRSGGKLKMQEAVAQKVLSQQKLHRDMVVHRGVSNLNTLAHMLGLKNAATLKENDIKKILQDKFDNFEQMIVTEKGFMSTSMPHAEKLFDAGTVDSIGIEFMIVLKKGTPAINVSSLSAIKTEQELLVAPGTKFEIIDMSLDAEDRDELAQIHKGNKKSWKIYLRSIPDSNEGVKREAA